MPPWHEDMPPGGQAIQPLFVFHSLGGPERKRYDALPGQAGPPGNGSSCQHRGSARSAATRGDPETLANGEAGLAAWQRCGQPGPCRPLLRATFSAPGTQEKACISRHSCGFLGLPATFSQTIRSGGQTPPGHSLAAIALATTHPPIRPWIQDNGWLGRSRDPGGTNAGSVPARWKGRTDHARAKNAQRIGRHGCGGVVIMKKM